MTTLMLRSFSLLVAVARGLWPMTTLRGLWPGAVTPRGLWPMIALRSLWLGGAARPVAIAADDDASWPVARRP